MTSVHNVAIEKLIKVYIESKIFNVWQNSLQKKK